MPTNFEHHLLNIITVIIHTCDIMFSFAIFVMEEICQFWCSSLDMFLVRVYSHYNKKFTCSTDQMNLEKFMLTHDKLNA